MAERVCSAAEIAASEQEVEAAGGPVYGPARVEIVKVNAGARTVTLMAPARGNNKPRKVVCPWDPQHVWARCPSDLSLDGQGFPHEGSIGTLYLAHEFSTVNGLAITGKWPNRLPGNIEYRPLRLNPRSILLTGFHVDTATEATIELLAPEMVGPDQAVEIKLNEPVTLNLSQAAYSLFPVPWRTFPGLLRAKATLECTAAVSARDKARAWAQVAAWEELVADPRACVAEALGEEDLAVARRILTSLK